MAGGTSLKCLLKKVTWDHQFGSFWVFAQSFIPTRKQWIHMDTGYHSVYAPGTGMLKPAFLCFSCEAGHIWARSFWAFRHLNCSKFSGPTTRAVVSALAACRGRSSHFPTLSRCSYFVLAETAMKLEIPSLLSTILSKLLRF